jgi:hypothetical protein
MLVDACEDTARASCSSMAIARTDKFSDLISPIASPMRLMGTINLLVMVKFGCQDIAE